MTILTIAISCLLSTSGTPAWSDPLAQPNWTAPRGHADPRDIVAHAKISLADAIGRALVACPGTAVEADLEGEIEGGKTDVFFEIMVVGKDGRLHEIKLDPASGAIRSNEIASDEAEELAEFQATLRHTELALAGLLAKVGEVVNGYPVKAALEMEHGQPRCEVAIVHCRYLIDAMLEARAGHLVELEFTAGPAERKQDEAEEEDEEEGGKEARGKRLEHAESRSARK